MTGPGTAHTARPRALAHAAVFAAEGPEDRPRRARIAPALAELEIPACKTPGDLNLAEARQLEASGAMAQIRQAMGSIQEATHQNLASTRQVEQAARDLNRLGARLMALVGAPANGAAPRLSA